MSIAENIRVIIGFGFYILKYMKIFHNQYDRNQENLQIPKNIYFL